MSGIDGNHTPAALAMRIGITGATGHIGQSVVVHACQAGHDVVAIGRRALPGLCEHRHADLLHSPAEGLLDGLDAVLHLAADTTGGIVPAETEVRFASVLAMHAAHRGLPLLVISSQAALAHAPSDYGRTKAAIEQAVLPHGAAVMRPGQVYGGAARGLYGQLLAMLRKLPVIPALYPRPFVQPVHVDDLAAAMLAVIASPAALGRVWRVAGPALPFDAFLAAIARHRLRTSRMRLPVPVWLLRALLVLASRVVGPRISAERLDSLTRLQVMDATADLQALDICLRPLADGLGPRGRPERRLLKEGSVLMRAFLGRRPYRFALRRYVQAMRALGIGHALPLPQQLLAYPPLVAALDNVAFRRGALHGNLAWRYAVAIRILEAQRQHACDFLHAPQQPGLAWVLMDGMKMVLRELHVRLLGPWARWMVARVP